MLSWWPATYSMGENYQPVYPDGPSGSRCRNCGSFVTDRFRRVFGDNDDTVHACRRCSTMRALRNGDGISEDPVSPH